MRGNQQCTRASGWRRSEEGRNATGPLPRSDIEAVVGRAKRHGAEIARIRTRIVRDVRTRAVNIEEGALDDVAPVDGFAAAEQHELIDGGDAAVDH